MGAFVPSPRKSGSGVESRHEASGRDRVDRCSKRTPVVRPARRLPRRRLFGPFRAGLSRLSVSRFQSIVWLAGLCRGQVCHALSRLWPRRSGWFWPQTGFQWVEPLERSTPPLFRLLWDGSALCRRSAVGRVYGLDRLGFRIPGRGLRSATSRRLRLRRSRGVRTTS